MIPFTKGHGLGNDYLVMDEADLPCPLSKVAIVELQTWQTTLEQDLKSIDARLASKAPSGGDDAALNEMRNAVAQIAKQLAAVDPQASSLSADAQNTKGAGYAIAVDKSASQDFAARKNELIAVLEARLVHLLLRCERRGQRHDQRQSSSHIMVV